MKPYEVSRPVKLCHVFLIKYTRIYDRAQAVARYFAFQTRLGKSIRGFRLGVLGGGPSQD
jgi:hypothetical protein